MIFHPAGIFFSTTDAFGSRRIRRWTQHRGEAPTVYSHVGLFCHAHGAHPIVIHAKLIGGVQVDSWDYVRGVTEDTRGGRWEVWRFALTGEIQDGIVEDAWAKRGTGYSVGEIGLHLVDGLLGKIAGRDVLFARRLGDLLPSTVCSSFAGGVLAGRGVLPHRLRYGSPDCLHDWVVAAEAGCELVAAGP